EPASWRAGQRTGAPAPDGSRSRLPLRGAERRRDACRHAAPRTQQRAEPAARPGGYPGRVPRSGGDGGRPRPERPQPARCPRRQLRGSAVGQVGQAAAIAVPAQDRAPPARTADSPVAVRRAASAGGRPHCSDAGRAVHAGGPRGGRVRPCRPAGGAARPSRGSARISRLHLLAGGVAGGGGALRPCPGDRHGLRRRGSDRISGGRAHRRADRPVRSCAASAGARGREQRTRLSLGRSRRPGVRKGGRRDAGAHRSGRGIPDRAVAHLPRRLPPSVRGLLRAAPARSQPVPLLRPVAGAPAARRLARDFGSGNRGRGRGEADRRNAPAWGHGGRRRPAGGGPAARRQGAGRAHDAGRPRPQRRRAGEPVRHPARGQADDGRALRPGHAPGFVGNRPARPWARRSAYAAGVPQRGHADGRSQAPRDPAVAAGGADQAGAVRRCGRLAERGRRHGHGGGDPFGGGAERHRLRPRGRGGGPRQRSGGGSGRNQAQGLGAAVGACGSAAM
ncbi:MAG: Anthranilate synthase, aminase component, partial [uncultured Sphingomonas sp.]